MSEWRYRPVPAGIANTVTGLLQLYKNTSVFAHCTALAPGPIPDVALRQARATRVGRCATRSSKAARTFSRSLRNTDNIWVFNASDFSREQPVRGARKARAIAKPVA